jgi:flagellum-specific peptidoglycan hydrolase FlgJ
MMPDEYLAWITGIAKEVCKKYDLPFECCVAQGAIESSWGGDRIGEFNLFGRKAVDSDNFIEVSTQEDDGTGNLYTITAKFKDYSSLNEAIDDWCQLMCWGPYQQYADQYHADHDLESFVRGIASVYATDMVSP